MRAPNLIYSTFTPIQHAFWHCGMGSWVGLPAHLPPWVQTARRLFITLSLACCLQPLGVSCGGPAHTCTPPTPHAPMPGSPGGGHDTLWSPLAPVSLGGRGVGAPWAPPYAQDVVVPQAPFQQPLYNQKHH